MFDNIGGKIKVLAQVLCYLGIAICCLAGFALFAYDFLAGLIVAIVGSILSWISSFLLYGAGQLIENTDIIIWRMPKKAETTTAPTAPVYKYICQKCGHKDTYMQFCPKCGSADIKQWNLNVF